MKKILSIILCILLFTCAATAVHADEPAQVPFEYFADLYGLMYEDEALLIEGRCQSISLKYDFGVYIIIIDDYSTIESDVYDTAVTVYEELDLGFGENKDGVILLLSMDDRDYSMVAHGSGETIFNEYARNAAIDEFITDFSDDEWYDGLKAYLDKCDQILKLDSEGTSLEEFNTKGVGYVISFILAVLVATIVCVSQRRKMRSVFKKGEAMDYIASGTGNITNRNVTYTHTTTTKTRISSSSSGGGRSSRSGGGYSGTSGKF